MDKKLNGLSREFIIHPGETLKEILKDREMPQRELAIRTNVTEAHVSNVINGQKSISVGYAKKLEYALNIDASFWINLQANYDKELADFEEVNNISSEEVEILKRLRDITDYLKKMGFLEPEVYSPILVLHLRRLLNVSCLQSIPEISQIGAYRLATTANIDPYVLFTWLRMCDLINSKQNISKILDLEKLKSKVSDIKKLMFKGAVEIEAKLKDYLGDCGIKFSIVRHFKGAPVQGVIKRNKDETLSLIMTNRGKFADIFWFTLFHEIGHILNGDVKEKLIDYECNEGDMESKADEFASSTLIDDTAYAEFVRTKDYSLTSIKSFSAKQHLPTFILIGRLQRDSFLEYYHYSEEKVKYELG
jgi:HTH-type transcriptional regulator/antitoxin HigA